MTMRILAPIAAAVMLAGAPAFAATAPATTAPATKTAPPKMAKHAAPAKPAATKK